MSNQNSNNNHEPKVDPFFLEFEDECPICRAEAQAQRRGEHLTTSEFKKIARDMKLRGYFVGSLENPNNLHDLDIKSPEDYSSDLPTNINENPSPIKEKDDLCSDLHQSPLRSSLDDQSLDDQSQPDQAPENGEFVMISGKIKN